MAAGTMTSEGQLTLPEQVRVSLGLKPGDKVEFVDMGDGKFAMMAATC